MLSPLVHEVSYSMNVSYLLAEALYQLARQICVVIPRGKSVGFPYDVSECSQERGEDPRRIENAHYSSQQGAKSQFPSYEVVELCCCAPFKKS